MIAIAGAGMGGLVLALALQERGLDVVVLEEAEAVRSAGAGISLWPNALAALDVAGLPPTAHPLPLSNVTRPDQVRPVLARDEVLSAAPDPAEGQFRVPPILGEAP